MTGKKWKSTAWNGFQSDKNKDSLRFYYLGDNYKTKIEHIGAKETIKVDEPLIF